MSTLALPVVLLKPARALETAAPVMAGGSFDTYHASGTLLVVSAGLWTRA